jgi:hypothetical protein
MWAPRGTDPAMEPPDGYVLQLRLAPESKPEAEADEELWVAVREFVGAWLVREN